jgi:DNA-directed RNA polymerase subunit beta'
MAKKIKFNNQIFSKKELKEVIYNAFTNYGITRACSLADELKNVGFNFATKAGISISIEDLKIPPTKKNLLLVANSEIKKSDLAYLRGEITSVERFQKIIDTWNRASETLKNDLVYYFRQTDPLNSIYLMAFSGARGNLSQVRQLVGMRGLMSDPNGQIIDIPIIHNFREGLTITDYIMSAYGARKGVVDTALRTADSGYLTRRLIDVAQDVIIREPDCLTKRSIKIYRKESDSKYIEKIIGRTIAETIYLKKIQITQANTQITHEIAQFLVKNKIYKVKLHSPLTCESTRSICQKCYGWDLANGKIVSLGEAIGIVAAQSIGEPGTQLTMRTFHTGGIFTADPSKQIRANDTGFFSFHYNTQKKPSRTIYGSKISILERESNFLITNYQNKKIKIKLPADSSLFVENKSFIKKDDLIAELPFKNRQTIKSKKYITAPHAGEVKVSSNSSIVWILKSEVYNLPFNSLFNNFFLKQKVYEYDNLVYFKLISKKEGILNIVKNRLTKQIEILKIIKCFQLLNFPIFWDKKSENLILKQKHNKLFSLNNKDINLTANNFNFATEYTNRYQTETGGQILYPTYSFLFNQKSQDKENITVNQKILYIPIETHIVNKAKSLLLIPNKTKLNISNIELIPGIFSKTTGFVQTKESGNILQEIQIKQGELYEYLNLNNEALEYLKTINKKIYFSGEIIFEDIIIQSLSLIEIIKTKNSYGILVRPIQEFNIPKPKNLLKSQTLINQTVQLKSINRLADKLNTKKHKKQPFNLINSIIKIEHKKSPNFNGRELKFYIIPNFYAKQTLNLAMMFEEIIDIPKILPKKLTEKKLKLAFNLKNFEYVEPQSLIGIISIKLEKQLEIEKIKKYNKNVNDVNVLLITKNNYNSYFNNNNSFLLRKNDMIKVGDKIEPLTKIKYSGQVISKKPFKFILHKGTPFYLTPETTLYKKSDQLIIKEEFLGIIKFEQIVTGDIVQGLPKVEEILEARKPQNPGFLAKNPGIVKKIHTKNRSKNLYIQLEMLGNFLDKNLPSAKIINYGMVKKGIQNIIIKKNDYIYLGQAITTGSINPHNLLIIYFDYYNNFFNNYEAAYLSFKSIQLLLIQKVQQVYNSQGVSIADKHLEVIIRRITSKIRISDNSQSFLLPGEILELKQIEYINLILKKSFKPVITYSPILLGITKASLMTESFIAAASFQETTRILTTAATEGKVDWLRGLKENVIIGRLIPVGTGFQHDQKTNLIK